MTCSPIAAAAAAKSLQSCPTLCNPIDGSPPGSPIPGSPITSWQIEGEKVEAVTDFIFLGSNITMDNDCCHEIKRHLLLGWKAMTNVDSILKQRHHFADKGPYSQSYCLSSSHVQMSKLDHKEGWPPKN